MTRLFWTERKRNDKSHKGKKLLRRFQRNLFTLFLSLELEELSIAYVLDARLKELLDLVGSVTLAAVVPLGDSSPAKLLF